MERGQNYGRYELALIQLAPPHSRNRYDSIFPPALSHTGRSTARAPCRLRPAPHLRCLPRAPPASYRTSSRETPTVAESARAASHHHSSRPYTRYTSRWYSQHSERGTRNGTSGRPSPSAAASVVRRQPRSARGWSGHCSSMAANATGLRPRSCSKERHRAKVRERRRASEVGLSQ